MEYVKLAILGLIFLAVKGVVDRHLQKRDRIVALVLVALVLSAAFHVAGF